MVQDEKLVYAIPAPSREDINTLIRNLKEQVRTSQSVSRLLLVFVNSSHLSLSYLVLDDFHASNRRRQLRKKYCQRLALIFMLYSYALLNTSIERYSSH
jgi:hypothetical protein